MSNKELREKGRIAFKANYWACVVASLLLTIIVALTTAAGGSSADNAADTAEESASIGESLSEMTNTEIAVILGAIIGVIVVVIIVSILIRLFLYNPLQVGCYRFFRKNTENYPVRLGVIKQGFGNYGHTFVTLLLRDLFLFLWTLLFLIPGIVKTYSYRLVPYIIKDNPELSASQVITRSRKLMDGYKGKAFLLDLSFIGWLLLSIITFGIVGIFWTNPYYESAAAAFYIDVKSNQQ